MIGIPSHLGNGINIFRIISARKRRLSVSHSGGGFKVLSFASLKRFWSVCAHAQADTCSVGGGSRHLLCSFGGADSSSGPREYVEYFPVDLGAEYSLVGLLLPGT